MPACSAQRSVIKKLWTFFGPWGRDRSQSPACWIFWVKQLHPSTASERTTRQLHYAISVRWCVVFGDASYLGSHLGSRLVKVTSEVTPEGWLSWLSDGDKSSLKSQQATSTGMKNPAVTIHRSEESRRHHSQGWRIPPSPFAGVCNENITDIIWRCKLITGVAVSAYPPFSKPGGGGVRWNWFQLTGRGEGTLQRTPRYAGTTKNPLSSFLP